MSWCCRTLGAFSFKAFSNSSRYSRFNSNFDGGQTGRTSTYDIGYMVYGTIISTTIHFGLKLFHIRWLIAVNSNSNIQRLVWLPDHLPWWTMFRYVISSLLLKSLCVLFIYSLSCCWYMTSKQQKPTEGKYSRLWSRSAIHKVPSLRSGLPFRVPVSGLVSGYHVDSALRVH